MLAPEGGSHASASPVPADDGFLRDIKDGAAFKQHQADFIHRDGIVLHFALAVDPFQPFLDDKKYSCTPFLAVPMTAPTHQRWSLAHTLCIVPGTTEQKKKVGLSVLVVLPCQEEEGPRAVTD